MVNYLQPAELLIAYGAKIHCSECLCIDVSDVFDASGVRAPLPLCAYCLPLQKVFARSYQVCRHIWHHIPRAATGKSVANSASKASASSASAKRTAAVAVTVQPLQVRSIGRDTSKRAHRYGVRSYGHSAFVPPPPAFMPSILPELTARRMRGDTTDDAGSDDDEPKPENPYKKYVHSPEGSGTTTYSTSQRRRRLGATQLVSSLSRRSVSRA